MSDHPHPEVADGDASADADSRRKRAELCAALLAFLSTFAGKVLVGCGVALVVVAALLTVGVLDDAGSAADWVAAGGAIFAAVIALNIATRDRRERKSERDDADHAQMRLVRVTVTPYSDSDRPDYNYRVTVINHGSRPILQVLVESANLHTNEEIFGTPAFRLRDPGSDPHVHEVIPHLEQQLRLTPGTPHQSFLIRIADDHGNAWDSRREQPLSVHVALACIDADGNHWMLSNTQDPQRHTAQQNPPVVQRLWANRGEVMRELRHVLAPNRRARRRLRVMALPAAAGCIAAAFALWKWRVVADVLLCGFAG
ncbi:hypothetical protein EB72_11715 [Mycobacterium sp. SWH-M1]|nr:hypothetical protein EB72_11715 [Mycobacterium sp. SWH-M1]